MFTIVFQAHRSDFFCFVCFQWSHKNIVVSHQTTVQDPDIDEVNGLSVDPQTLLYEVHFMNY